MVNIGVPIFGEGTVLLFFNTACLYTLTKWHWKFRSVHNIRIERLWVDVTAQVGATWAQVFIMLELHHGLNINNQNHIWFLHYIFLSTINQQLDFFAQAWNHHRIQIRNGPSRSPADMFGFDMLVHGVHGYQLPTPMDGQLPDEELEVFGVDWEGLQDENILQSRQTNNPADEAAGTWLAQNPPQNLNQVDVDPPAGIFTNEEILAIDHSLFRLLGAVGDDEVAELWTEALLLARSFHPDLF